MNDNTNNTKFNIKNCKILQCNKCDISIGNTIVNGNGNLHSGIIMLGEAPGYYERKFGVPFVGKSGNLLNTMLDLIGLTRDDIYVTNVIKCQPFNNRTPLVKEIKNCNVYLKGELYVGRPRIVVLLGNTALNAYYGTRTLKINTFMGRIITTNNVRVIAMYHPSYILRNSHNAGLMSSYVNSFRKVGLLYRWLINPLITMKI